MEEMLNYTLKASLGLLALYLFYYVLLRRQNSFNFNRIYLLLAPLTALLLPVLTWPAILSPEAAVQETLQAVRLSEVMVTAYSPATTQMSASAFTLTAVLTCLYLTGTAVLLYRLFRQLWQINKAKAAAIPVVTDEDAAIYQLDSHYPTFAFGNSVFLSRQQEQLSEPEQQQVLAHELAHVHFGHTWDVLFYELLSVILWFHPAVWLLKQELRDVHEYQADAAVVKEHQTQQYTSLLSREALLSMGLPVGSHFTKPQVLKRLHMLQRQGQKPGWLRPLLVLPLLGGLAFVLARQQASALPASGKGAKANMAVTSANSVTAPASTGPDIKPTTEPEAAPEKSRPYSFVEKMPDFEGGEAGMLKFLGMNIRYPKQAQQDGTEGLVVMTFVVEDDGSLHDIEVMKGVEPSIDAEATRVVHMMDGKWSPGTQNGKAVPVRYTLPIRFAIK